MKRIVWIVPVLLLLACNENLSDFELVEIDPVIQEAYFDDAVELYLREIHADKNHFNYNNPELDENELNEILSVFQMVYKLNLPECDTVFSYFNIHALKCIGTKSIVMQVNAEAPEIIKLVNSDFPTGNKQLDYLIETYQFDSVRTSYNYPNFSWLSVNTGNVYNLLPLMHEFEKIPSILIAENNGGCFDGNNIILERNRDDITIDFSVGSGDCPSGCIYRKHWIFEIRNGKARLLDVREG